jgi:addiction module antidote protein, HigA family
MREVPLPTPGEILLHHFLEPWGMSADQLAERCSLPPDQVKGVINGTQPVTPEIDAALTGFMGLTPGFWLRGQEKYDEEMS